jgi:hypothetical protein
VITGRASGLLALAAFLAFCVSLSLDLHGAVAVVTGVAFAFFLSAAIGPERRVARLIKRAIGAALMLALLGLLKNPDQNLAFVLTVTLCGALLAFDALALWVTNVRTA